jgi:glutaredoxin
MLQPKKLPSPNEILGTTNKLPSPNEILGSGNDNQPLKKKNSSESVAPQEPQTPTTELPSEDGFSATPQPSKKFSLTSQDLKDINKKQPTDMSGKPLLPNLKESQKIINKVYKENQALAAEKKKYGDMFDKQMNIKPRVEESQYLKDRLSTIDTELINQVEEFVVPKLEYQFGDLGFEFEKSGALGDYVKVTAPNNKTTEISLDNLFDSKSKKQSEILQKFIKDNTPAKGLFVLEKTMREQDKKFNSEKQVDESIKVISNEVTALNAKQKQFLLRKSSFEKALQTWSSSTDKDTIDLLEKERLALNEEMKSILQEEETIKQKSKRLDTAVGKYSISKAKQGTWGGAIVNAIDEGFSSISAGTTSLGIDISTEIAPAGFGMSPKDLKDVSIDIANKIGIKGPSEKQTVDQWKKTLTENQLDKWEDGIDDYIKKDIKSRTLPYIRIGNREIFGDAATTKQFSDLKEKGFWGGAILGVAKSLPAMIGGAGPAGWAQRTAQMYAQISDGLAVEMENNPQFADITENEKLAITLPIGITSAVLEAYGLRNVMASKGVINSLTMSALGRAGAGASAKTFRELVENEVESKLARGLITITAAGVAEFETGAAQELTETGFKVIYDKLKEKDMFNTPDSTVDLIENVLVAGAQEAIGGFVLGVPSGVSAAYSKKGFLKMDDATFETFANMANDEKMQSAYIASLKEKITQGIITEKEAKEELNNYRNSAGLYRQLPDGLTTEQQKEAMNLLKEKRDLENFVEGKDPALVVKAKNRITEINDSLTKLSETDAVQEQSTTEVPVQSETGISETMEGRTPEAEPQVVTEQTTQEEIVGIPDEVSQPIELSVSAPAIEVVPEQVAEGPPPVPEGFDIVTETAPVTEPILEEAPAPKTKTEIKVQQKIDQIDAAIQSLFDRNGEDTSKWANPQDNTNLIALKRAKKAVAEGVKSFNTFLSTPMGKRYSEMEAKFEAPVIETKAEEAVVDTKTNDKFSKEDLIETLNSLGGQVIDEGELIGYNPKGSNLYYWFKEQYNGDWNNVSYTWSNSKGKMKSGTRGLDLKIKIREARKSKSAEVDKIKSDIDASKQKLKKAWDKYKTMGIAFDPKNNLARDRELVKSLVEYAYNNIRLGSYEASKLIKDLAEQGFEITKDGAKFIMDRASKKVQREINKTVGVKKKPTEQKRINKSYAIGVANQRVATEEAKAEVKDLKGQVVDVFRAGIDAVKITQATAKEKAKNIKEVSQQLVKDIKELESTGKITPTQALNMISKFNKVNMLNEVSVSNFVDYMAKVFADAEYDNKINVAKGKLKAAKKNINTKIGIADGLVGPLQRLFAINPQLIPEPFLERYLELVDIFGARQAVLSLEEKSKVTKDVVEILEEINNERSAVEELSERFNYSDNQVIEDGKLSYSATVKNMLKEGEITEEEASLMTKYKSEIAPKVEKSTLSEDELQQEKDDLVEEVKKSTINTDDLPTRTERDAAKKLASLIKSLAIKELSNTQLKNLLKVIDNINNGYFAHSAQLIIEEINSINNSKSLESSVKRAKLLPLSKIYAQVKSIFTRKDAVLEMIRRNPLFNIDQVLGDFKTKDVFNSLLESAAEAEAKFTSELKAIQLKLTNAEEKIAKSFKLDANKTLMSKFKMMTYMVQLEYNSNPDSKQVNPASKFIEATINHINEGKSQFGEKDVEMLQEILDNYTDADGNIDVKELYNSFNSAEKAGIKTIQEVNQSLKEKAEYTASVIRGQRINPLSNYIHLNVLSDTKPNDLASGESFADQYNNSLKPSTKAKSLIERTGKVSPLNFDVFASAQKGAKFVLMDFHLTEPIRTARKTINKTMDALGKVDKDKRRIINAISNSFEESVENLVNNSYIETSIGDDVANYIKKQGYRSVLAGTGRFAAEFLSNVGFVIISDPTTFAEGLKHTAIIMSPEAPSIMHNVNSKEINRIFPSDTLSGRLIDTNILNEANGIKGGKAKNKIINKAQQIWNLTGKKYKNAVELTSDVLITTPDKAIMRPIWFGSFAANFKNETGQDVDFKKIAANDEVYMSKNKEAIDKAKDAADERSVITGASNNAFTGVLKGTSKPNQSNFIKGFNNFNSFMTRFLIYEYTSARTGIMAAMGNGSLSKRQGIALLGAVTTRMTVYSLLSKALGSGLIGLLFGDDDDDEEKSLDKSVGQALTSTFTSLLFNRDFGNASKAVINEGIERINENYLQSLREGDYDPYKDAIQYTAIPIEKKGKQTGLYDYVESISGAYGPAIKTTNLIIKTYSGEDKKETDAIQRQEDVKNIRIPLEVLGNAGFIPLYKDIRKEVMKEIYKGLDDKSTPNLRTVKEGDEFK